DAATALLRSRQDQGLAARVDHFSPPQLPPPQDDSPPPSSPSPSDAAPSPSAAFAPQEPAPQACSAPLAASPASGSAAFFEQPLPTRLSPRVAAAIVRTFARNLESMVCPLMSTTRR